MRTSTKLLAIAATTPLALIATVAPGAADDVPLVTGGTHLTVDASVFDPSASGPITMKALTYNARGTTTGGVTGWWDYQETEPGSSVHAKGDVTCLVSGGFTAFADKIAAAIGFDEASANRLLLDPAGRLSGTVAEPILGREAKLATLMALRARLGLTADETLAVGDGANDLDMIMAAGLGVAFHAKPAVAAAAAARIDHGDLTALLFAQGYRRGEFVE